MLDQSPCSLCNAVTLPCRAAEVSCQPVLTCHQPRLHPARCGLVMATVNPKIKLYLNLKYDSSHCFLGFWKLVETKLISLLCLYIYWRQTCPMGRRLMWMWSLCSMEQETEWQKAWKRLRYSISFVFPSVFTGQVCPQAFQPLKATGRVCGNDTVPPGEEGRVRAHLSRPSTCNPREQIRYILGCWESWLASLQKSRHPWKVTGVRGGSWWLKQGKHHTHLQKGQAGWLRSVSLTSAPSRKSFLITWKVRRWLGFSKGKSCLTNLTAPWTIEEQKALYTLTSARLILFSLY